MKMKIETSVGDFMDRMTILAIKKENGLDVDAELLLYKEQINQFDPYAFARYFEILKSVNAQLWFLEDRKRRGVERYSTEESDVAFMITDLNDCRHHVKKAIDRFFKSELTERKSHNK